MALHKFWVALSPATLAPIYLWRVFGIRSVTNFWKIALSAAMGYGTAFLFALLWKLVSVPAAVDQEKTKELAEQKKATEERIRQLEDAAKIEAESRKVEVSASLKTEREFAPLFMKVSSRFSASQALHVPVSKMSLVIYNLGEKSVRLTGYRFWKLAAVGAVHESSLHALLTLNDPTTVDVTEPLLRVISGQPRCDFESLPGKYQIRFVLSYFQDSRSIDSKPFDFEVTCQREGGGVKIKISAEEIMR